MRASLPSVQYETPRCTKPLLEGVPFFHVSGSYTQIGLPVPASSATACERDVVRYRIPSTIRGVASHAQVLRLWLFASPSSTDRHVQAIFMLLKLAALIWSRA